MGERRRIRERKAQIVCMAFRIKQCAAQDIWLVRENGRQGETRKEREWEREREKEKGRRRLYA